MQNMVLHKDIPRVVIVKWLREDGADVQRMDENNYYINMSDGQKLFFTLNSDYTHLLHTWQRWEGKI